MTSTPKKGYEDKSDFKKSLTPLTDSLPFSESDRVDWSSTETKESSSSTSTPSYFSRDPELLDSSSTGSRKSSSSTLTEDYLGGDSEYMEPTPSTSQEWGWFDLIF
ncbi:unnamed protein product [Hymenolepis diminuta]|uniref:Uncharacterized protein n=1 Tax=Hymenolepis diminuta TaxID=6216 RepID=A0A0R3SAU7_HYMDI|nr:unnamed protein product [Hymenolepis diminuta]